MQSLRGHPRSADPPREPAHPASTPRTTRMRCAPHGKGSNAHVRLAIEHIIIVSQNRSPFLAIYEVDRTSLRRPPLLRGPFTPQTREPRPTGHDSTPVPLLPQVQERMSEPPRLSQIEASRSHQCLFRATNNSPTPTNGLHNLPTCETEREAQSRVSRGGRWACKEPRRCLSSSHGDSHAEPPPRCSRHRNRWGQRGSASGGFGPPDREPRSTGA